ncbi:hypothetical protein H5J22_00150 [Cetobacterium sp. 8H]|uniref:hypothetical protein n=1 Tax=Cetobacterium sp. 8H TaxID=2759681 RepID=UPI00163BBF63|nr:hypothetical protein [Cetobacterium sp. 8H]MBC2849858.1 hypothetical protein [Cetobacterium sp. 8H]MBC2849871.1 hypothetical protein [Cetobacterium sp. 8H]
MYKEYRRCGKGNEYFCDLDRRFKCTVYCPRHKDYGKEPDRSLTQREVIRGIIFIGVLCLILY